MVVTDLIETPEIKQLFKDNFDYPKITDKPEIAVKYSHNNPQLVGTAFDILYRISLAKINGMYDVFEIIPFVNSMLPEYKNSGCKDKLGILGDSINGIKDYLQNKGKPIIEIIPDMVILSLIENDYRAGIWSDEWDYEEKELDDVVDDLINLMSNIPVKQLGPHADIIFNPHFNCDLVDGADADIIIDGVLYEIKCYKNIVGTARTFRQLMIYYYLNKYSNNCNGLINQIGIYFPRHKYIIKWDIQTPKNTKFETELINICKQLKCD